MQGTPSFPPTLIQHPLGAGHTPGGLHSLLGEAWPYLSVAVHWNKGAFRIPKCLEPRVGEAVVLEAMESLAKEEPH